ncbi:SDR family NAD(P)-dependent oxidoreductase [Elusimicrobiota bacterium]
MTSNIYSLKDKIAVVTGGNRGIGKAIAMGFLNAGANIVIAGRRDEEAAKAMEDFKKTSGEYLWVKADVRDIDDIEMMINKTIEKFGKIDILVNNAGIGRVKSAFDHTVEDWENILNTNLIGAFNCTKIAALRMIQEKTEGSIINVGSIQGIRGYKKLVAFACSKAGLIQLTRIFAVELAKYNIRVNAILPGLIETNALDYLKDDSVLLNKVIKMTPLQRIGQPEDLIGSAVYLASDAAGYTTGEISVVDGGLSML